MKKLRILSFIFCLLICFNLVGCGIGEGSYECKKFVEPEQYNVIESGTVAENQQYRLEWNADYGSVALIEKATNNVWSTIPPDANDNGVDEFGFPIEANPRVNSPIYIQYINASTRVTEFMAGYPGSVSMETMDCEIVDNGLKVTYYFVDNMISVPVVYTLRDNGMSISLNPKDVTEGENELLSVTLAPYLCSTKNTASKDDFIFVPSGSGALIYPKAVSPLGISYSEQMYGKDATMQTYDKVSNTENLLLPVCAAKNGDKATLVVIEKGAESASLEGVIGSETLNYSNIGATFYLRGYDERHVTVGTGGKARSTLYANSLIENEVSIGVYPIAGENANINGIADAYKSYLKARGFLSELSDKQSKLHLEIYGGVMTAKSFLGVPYETLYQLTTLKEAQSIVSELSEVLGNNSSIELKGYGSSGLHIGKLAGEYKIAGSLGSKKQLKQLQEEVNENGGTLYFNFDILSIGKSANGWSYHNDIAKGPTGIDTYQYEYVLSTRAQNSKVANYGLLSRSQVVSSAEKLLKKTQSFELEGIGIDKLSNTAYSDYANIRSYSKDNMGADVQQAINVLKNDGAKKILASNANMYAAVLADEITDVPLQSGKHDAFDVDVPFYQMVLRGYVSLSTSPLNSSTNKDEALLAALESGTGLSYSIANNYSSQLISFTKESIGRSVYSDVKESIINDCERTAEYYKAVGNSEIKTYEIISDTLRKTVFSNGTEVYVNYGDAAVATPDGSVEAKDFLVKEAG